MYRLGAGLVVLPDTSVGRRPRAGAALAIRHRFLGFGVDRVGRILRWHEFDPADARPAGYSFSDLSARGPRHGFPHVFGYSLRPAGRNNDRCRLQVAVRGRWTAPVPRWAAKLWLWWVFAHVVLSVRNAFLAAAVARGNSGGRPGGAVCYGPKEAP